MTDRIFISYRRQIDSGNAGRLFDRLRSAFRSEGVFMDVDGMRSGDDWEREVENQVMNCDVVIVAVGSGWTDVKDASGGRRLDQPKDMVRFEIESALKADKIIIPVLMHDAVMPKSDELPESIRRLARLQALELRHSRYDVDVDALIDEIQSKLDEIAAVRNARAERERRRKETSERRFGLAGLPAQDQQSVPATVASTETPASKPRGTRRWLRNRSTVHALIGGATAAILIFVGWLALRPTPSDIGAKTDAAAQKANNSDAAQSKNQTARPKQEEGQKQADAMPCPTYAQGSYFRLELQANFSPDPRTFEISAGGDVPLEKCRPDMKGWVSREPHLALIYEGGDYPLTIEVRSTADTILLINDADQVWHFDDDSAGSPNPRIRFAQPRRKRGRYDIWVGTFERSSVKMPAQLIITERR